MDDSKDSTEVLRMRSDFRGFLERMDKSAKPAARLKPMRLEEGSLNNSGEQLLSSSRMSSSSVTIGRLIEKENEVKQKEAELIEAKATIAELQNKVATTETSRKRQRIEYEHEVETFKQEKSQAADRVEELKHQLHLLIKKEEEAQAEVSDYRKQLIATKATFNTQRASLQKEKHELEARHEELEHNSRVQIMQLKKEKMRQETEMEICRSELKETQEQLNAAQKRCGELKIRIKELEEYRIKCLDSDVKVQNLKTTVDRMTEDAVVTKAMKSQLNRLAELEKENRILKEENSYCKNTQENVHLLREELESAKQKLSRAEARALEASKLQAQCEDLQERLAKWESCSLPGSTLPSSPVQLGRHLMELQNTNLLLLEKQGNLASGARTMEQTLASTQEELRKLRLQQKQSTRMMNQNGELVKRLKRKLLLLEKERDGYKEILDSYESEVTVNVNSSTGMNRIQRLEEALQGYRQHVEQLEVQLEQMSAHCTAMEAKAAQLQGELENHKSRRPSTTTSEVDQKMITGLREQVAECQKELESVIEEKERLAARIEQRHLQGDYDPTTTKVLHMKINPASIVQQQRASEIRKLKEEKQTLEERLRLLEETGGQAEDVTVRVQEKLAQPSTSEEMEAMRASLNASELKNKRLMEAFKKKSHEFREVCFQLLGYRIDIPTDNQYRLMNIYAESPEDYLIFQQTSSGVMQLLSTEYSATLSDKMETYLQQADSIPAFLSSVTLMLFNRQTMFQQSMVSS